MLWSAQVLPEPDRLRVLFYVAIALRWALLMIVLATLLRRVAALLFDKLLIESLLRALSCKVWLL